MSNKSQLIALYEAVKKDHASLLVERDALSERMKAIQHSLDIHQAKIEAFEAAISVTSATNGELATNQNKSSIKKPKRTARGVNVPGGKRWLQLYACLQKQFIEPFTYADLEKAAEQIGFKVTMGAYRAQMMNAVNVDIFKREGAGEFVFTEYGRGLVAEQTESESVVADSDSATKNLSTLFE